eukprot:SAG11_NODE_8068_length_1063_cov_1.606846_1_plen_148_part_10
MADTDALFDVGYAHSLNAKNLDLERGRIHREEFGSFWDALGENVANSIRSRQGVLLPRFGAISVVAPAPGHIDPDKPGNRKHSTPAFVLDNLFASRYCARQRTKSSAQGPHQRIARNHPYSWTGKGVETAMAANHEICFHRLGGQIDG